MQCLIRFSVVGQITKHALVGLDFPANVTLTALNEIPTLRILELKQVQVYISKGTCSRIKGMMSQLTALRVRQCNGFSALMNCVAQSLTCTTSLVELEMSDSCLYGISDQTYVNLFRAIKRNGTLKKLDVSKMGYDPVYSHHLEEMCQIQWTLIGRSLGLVPWF